MHMKSEIDQAAIGSSFEYDWLRKWRKFSAPITEPLTIKIVSAQALTQLYILKVGVLYRKPKEVQDTFILRSSSHMFCHLVPIVFEHFQALKKENPPNLAFYVHYV